MLGIGAAWYGREHAGLGVPFPSTSERFERLEEALQVCRRVWSDDDSPYEGRHYRLAEPVGIPAPLREGGPRVLVGGSGEKKTLRLVAKYADACNLFGDDPDQIRHKLAVLDAHCETEGRDPAEVQRTVIGGNPLEDVDGFLRRMEALAALGIDQVWVGPDAADPVGSVTRLVETVLPRLADL
jgi:alkanesulfonate monooxygenase SsuD/methylene tetrahydromethanopterin reductase-like flavin-dependent oxidoreductase (luciferase family)